MNWKDKPERKLEIFEVMSERKTKNIDFWRHICFWYGESPPIFQELRTQFF